MKRGLMYRTAREHGYNVLALAQHLDDLAESFLMSAFHGGKLKTMKALGVGGSIEDILITLDSQYHIITMVKSKEGLFMYTVLDKAKSNLAMARYKALEAQGKLSI